MDRSHIDLKLALVKLDDGEEHRIDLSKAKDFEKEAWAHICIINNMDGYDCGKYTTHKANGEKALYVRKVRH